jgi:hypothetical protein
MQQSCFVVQAKVSAQQQPLLLLAQARCCWASVRASATGQQSPATFRGGRTPRRKPAAGQELPATMLAKSLACELRHTLHMLQRLRTLPQARYWQCWLHNCCSLMPLSFACLQLAARSGAGWSAAGRPRQPGAAADPQPGQQPAERPAAGHVGLRQCVLQPAAAVAEWQPAGRRAAIRVGPPRALAGAHQHAAWRQQPYWGPAHHLV